MKKIINAPVRNNFKIIIKLKNIYLKNIEKLNRVDIDFSPYQRDWEEFEQNNTSVTLNVLFASYNSEEIKLAYK